MKKHILFVIFILFPLYLTSGDKHFYNMSNKQIDSLLNKVSREAYTITERMSIFSAYFLGTPYNFKCVGDGPYALLEDYPLVNFKETNCMALCEHVLALSISDSWDIFFNNLMHIRYKDGLIGMKTRNHYTMADWVPQNNWLLNDVSAKVGGKYTKKMTRTISHRKFFAAKGMTSMDYVLDDRTITINYIPLQYLDKIESNLKQGDILTLLFAHKKDIFAAHMVMFFISDGNNIIREATTRGMTTIDTPYAEWIKVKQGKNADRYAGISVVRVKKELNYDGQVIYPGDICNMKTK